LGWYRQWCISHSCKGFHRGTSESFGGYPTENYAVAAWNTRTPQPAADRRPELTSEPIKEDRLIAEAPAMLEALRSVLPFLSGFEGDELQDEPIDPALASVRAILSRIDGGGQ